MPNNLNHHQPLKVLTIIWLLVAILLLNGWTTQAQEPVLDKFIYLPLVIKSITQIDCDAFEPNNSPDQATLIQSGQTQTHCIVPEEDSDWFKFSVSENSQVVIELAGEEGDTELRLYDAMLAEIELDYDDGIGYFSRIDRLCGYNGDFLRPGAYFARVEEWLNWREIENYTITLSITPCPTMEVLSTHTAYVYDTYIDYLAVVGEVKNNSGSNGVEDLDMVVNLFNSDNQLIDTADASILLSQYSWEDSALAPGDKTCFIVLFDVFDGWSYYEFEEPRYSYLGSALENMTIHGDVGTYLPETKDYRLLGFVRNDNNVQVTNVDIVITLYNSAGNVIDCGSISANNSPLEPGQETSFERDFTGRSDYNVATYRLQVDGEAE